ncbi:MAG: hypothetical protein U9Q82_14810 [Chloroflexota bacterium]|nr:hypothetical protein [Chloroflexota bacterium]
MGFVKQVTRSGDRSQQWSEDLAWQRRPDEFRQMVIRLPPLNLPAVASFSTVASLL